MQNKCFLLGVVVAGLLIVRVGAEGLNVLEIGAGPGWTLTDWVAKAARDNDIINPEITRSVIAKWWRQSGHVMKEMLANPKETSAITESSPWVAQWMASHIKGKIDRFDIVEGNQEFCKTMKRHYENSDDQNKVFLYPEFFDKNWEPRITNGKCIKYDVIIATLPFTRLDDKMIKDVLESSYKLLKKGGKFICVYLLWSRMLLKVEAVCSDFFSLSSSDDSENEEVSARDKALQKLSLLDGWLESGFDRKRKLVKRNFPPLWVHVGTKRA